jgi:hypothetical protein
MALRRPGTSKPAEIMKSIAIDMDNVIADIESQYIAWYQQKFGVAIPKEQLMGVPETEAFPDKEAVYQFLIYARVLPYGTSNAGRKGSRANAGRVIQRVHCFRRHGVSAIAA